MRDKDQHQSKHGDITENDSRRSAYAYSFSGRSRWNILGYSRWSVVRRRRYIPCTVDVLVLALFDDRWNKVQLGGNICDFLVIRYPRHRQNTHRLENETHGEPPRSGPLTTPKCPSKMPTRCLSVPARHCACENDADPALFDNVVESSNRLLDRN